MANKIDGFNQTQPLVTGGGKSGAAGRADELDPAGYCP